MFVIMKSVLLARTIQMLYTVTMYAWGIIFPDPKLLTGPGCVKELPKVIKKKRIKKVMILTDEVLMKLGSLDGLIKALEDKKIEYEIFDKVEPNPSIQTIKKAAEQYIDTGCQAVIAFGGGSPIDTAKGVVAKAARPDRDVAKFRGTFKVILPSLGMKKLIPPAIFAVPTTHGTGSETTIAAVVTNTETHDKFSIMDPFIRPRYAVLDPELVATLPKSLTSTTSLDALTHAIEGYTNIWYNNKKFNDYGLKAIKLIFDNVLTAYEHPEDLDARSNLLLASYYAGLCFTRGGVGYVHGIGHRLGGLYGVPHGLAMSVILPHVFGDSFLGPYVYDKLAEIADYVGIDGKDEQEKAHKLIDKIKDLKKKMDIPDAFDCIKDEDVKTIAKRCNAEIVPTYPTKHIFKIKEIEKFIRKELMIK